uniref:Dolichyl-phosphate-mannose-protein mannosyltransferase n=1 Tax=Candidatus Kentrum sp. LFY TaxID=2126342 RepID=A0A450V250_9GAMM|nr:MAG: hypothetical protein BECKLFY1418A_GA0070994_10897 [Candidatus Kentron sp. LFY]
MRSLFEKTRSVEFYALLFVSMGFFVCWVAFYPGFMTLDSLDQYEMSKSLLFSDWHPPIMSWVWSILNFFFEGPSGLLALHLFMLWFALYIWWYSYKQMRFSWLILLIGYLPWVINFSGVLLKDVGMAFSILLLLGLGLFQPSRIKFFFAFGLLFYAINVRHNAIFAVIPVVIFLMIKWFPKLPIWKSILFSFAVIFITIVAGYLFNYHLLDSERTKPSSFMIIDDLVYLSVKKEKSLIPGISLEELQACANRETGQTKLLNKASCLSQRPSYKNPISADLEKIWINHIVDSPLDYIRFRLAAFSYLIRSPDDKPYFIWHHGIDENRQGLKAEKNRLTFIIKHSVRIPSKIFRFLFKPYWWLWLAFIVLFISLLLKPTSSTRVAQVLLISALLYMLGYIPITQMADFRYVYWSVISITLALFLLIIEEPTFESRFNIKSVFLFSASILISLFLYNFNKLFSLDMDASLEKSLAVVEIPIQEVPRLNHLIAKDGSYFVVGNDPSLVFDVTSMRLNPNDLRFLKFDFLCSGQRFSFSRPVREIKLGLQLFWWGNNQSGPSESQSLTVGFQKGTHIIPLGVEKNFLSVGSINGIKLSLIDPDLCRRIKVDSISFYH